jgi:hypothetical protein
MATGTVTSFMRTLVDIYFDLPAVDECWDIRLK